MHRRALIAVHVENNLCIKGLSTLNKCFKLSPSYILTPVVSYFFQTYMSTVKMIARVK